MQLPQNTADPALPWPCRPALSSPPRSRAHSPYGLAPSPATCLHRRPRSLPPPRCQVVKVLVLEGLIGPCHIPQKVRLGSQNRRSRAHLPEVWQATHCQSPSSARTHPRVHSQFLRSPALQCQEQRQGKRCKLNKRIQADTSRDLHCCLSCSKT